MKIASLIRRHPLSRYFGLAYGITWSGILVLLALKGFQLNAIRMQDVLLIFLFMVLGPSGSSLIMTGLLEGREGFHSLRLRLTRWKAGIGWYWVALLTTPLLALSILSLLSAIVAPAYAPKFNIIGLIIGSLAGGLEEIGWTGFATPRLLRRFNPLRAGLILGLLWAVWHILADFSGNIAAMGSHWPLWFLVFWILPLPAYRILMTWVYANTKSIPLSQLMHASYTGWLMVLSPTLPFKQGLLWQGIFAASLWVLVGVVILLKGGEEKIGRG